MTTKNKYTKKHKGNVKNETRPRTVGRRTYSDRIEHAVVYGGGMYLPTQKTMRKKRSR